MCDKTCKSIEDFKSHLKNHPEVSKKISSSIKLKFFVCKLCGKVFKSKIDRDSHINLNHGFWIKLERMQRTKFSEREKEKKISKQVFTWNNQKYSFDLCTICNKAFKRGKKCKKHVKKCEGPFSYSCHFCGRNFMKLELLKVSTIFISKLRYFHVKYFIVFRLTTNFMNSILQINLSKNSNPTEVLTNFWTMTMQKI